MADPVAAPAVAPAPVAPVLKANEAMVPFEIGNLEHDAHGNDDPIETAPEQAVEEEAAPDVAEAPKPTRLAKFRNADGSLNEDLIEQVERSANEAGATVAEIQRAYNNDPVFRLNYIKWRQSTGQTLTAEQHAELAAKPAEPTKPAEPKYTMDQLTAHFDKLVAEGNHGAAQRFWHEFVTLPELKKRDDAMAERDARDAKASEQSAANAHLQTISNELKTAMEIYPGLVIEDASLPQGYRITNDRVFSEVSRLMALKGETMQSRIDMALYRLKMKPPEKAAVKAAVKPTVAVAAPRTTAPPRKLKPNEYAVPAFIVGDETFQ